MFLCMGIFIYVFEICILSIYFYIHKYMYKGCHSSNAFYTTKSNRIQYLLNAHILNEICSLFLKKIFHVITCL